MMQTVINLSYLLLLLVVGILIYSIIVTEPNGHSIGYCGTSSLVNRIPKKYNVSETVNVERGKKIFKANCAACHNKNMKDDLTGPALGGTFRSWKRDTVQYALYLSNSKTYIDTTTNEKILAVHKEFGFPITHNFQLTNDEVRSVIGYIEAVAHF